VEAGGGGGDKEGKILHGAFINKPRDTIHKQTTGLMRKFRGCCVMCISQHLKLGRGKLLWNADFLLDRCST
jgi:hypothetical protein